MAEAHISDQPAASEAGGANIIITETLTGHTTLNRHLAVTKYTQIWRIGRNDHRTDTAVGLDTSSFIAQLALVFILSTVRKIYIT